MNWPAPPPPIASSETSSDVAKTTPAKSSNRLSNLFSNMKIPKLKLNRKQTSTSGGSKSGSPMSSDEVDKDLPKKPLPTSRSEQVDLKTSQQKYGRSMSVSSDDGGGFVRGSGERHSYRVPTATSRYMQAAEAYASKKRSDRLNPNLTKPILTIFLKELI